VPRRLVSLLDLARLPVTHHSRLFREPLTHVAFSVCGSYLAAAAASTGRVALLRVTGAGAAAELLGYASTEGVWGLLLSVTVCFWTLVTSRAFDWSLNCDTDLLSVRPHVTAGQCIVGLCSCAVSYVLLCCTVPTAGPILSLCWHPPTTHVLPQLVVSLVSSSLLLLTPPAQPARRHGTAAHAKGVAASTTANAAANSGSGDSALNISPAELHAECLAAPAPLQAVAVLPQAAGSTSTAGRSSTAASGAGLQLLAAGCDGSVYWLQLAAETESHMSSAGSHGQAGASHKLAVTNQVLLPWPVAALAVSPGGQELLAAAADGAVLLLPTAAAAATAVVAAAGPVAASGVAAAAGAPAAVLAWGANGAWAVLGGVDGSLSVYLPGTAIGHGCT
jgi:hypothetical protein